MMKYYLIYLLLVFLLSAISIKVRINGFEDNRFFVKIGGAFLFTIVIGNLVGLPILGIISLFVK